MLPALLRTRSTAEALIRRAASHVSTLPPASCMVLPPSLTFPAPEPLTDELVVLGLDEYTARRVSSIFLQFTARLRSTCESDHERRLRSQEVRRHFFHDAKSSTLMSSAYLAIYNRRIASWRSYLLNDVTPRLLAAQARRQREGASSLSRRPFNQVSMGLALSHSKILNPSRTLCLF